MNTSVGVGRSESRDSYRAGDEAAAQATARLEGAPALVLVFATTGHDQAQLIAGVRAVTGSAPLSGCSAEGIITRSGSEEGSHAVAVMAIASDELRFVTLSARGLAAEPRRCGRELGAGIAGTGDGRLLLLFPDGLTLQSAELFAGLEESLERPIPIVGGAAGEMMHFERTYQYHDGAVLSDAVAGVLVAGRFELELDVSHGCDVVGTERTVTRAQGGQVFEIDGQPAWSVVQEYLEDGSEDLDGLAVSYSCLAEALPAPAGEGYGAFVIRVPLKLDKSNGALFFPGELRPGAKVFMARRDPEQVRETAIRSAARIAGRRPGQTPLAVLQFDCTGRGRMLFGEHTTKDLIEPMQQAFGRDTPWLGFHTYGEIAPMMGRPYFHNYTVVLCALYR